MNPTLLGWIIYLAGFTALTIMDRLRPMGFEAFRAVVLALALPSLWLLFRGSRGKGTSGIRIILVITQFWLAYAASALIFLIASRLGGQ